MDFERAQDNEKDEYGSFRYYTAGQQQNGSIIPITRIGIRLRSQSRYYITTSSRLADNTLSN